MTVGEMVEVAASAARQRHYTEHPPRHMSGCGGFSASDDAGRMWIVRGLKALGIWDAEVHEGRLLVDANGETGPNEVQLLAEDASYAVIGHDGSALRIIVLPAKGE